MEAWRDQQDDVEPPETSPEPSCAAPVHLVQIDVGGGKSVTARKLAAKELVAMRERGDTSTIAIAVPTHQLGLEQQLAFEALPEVRDAGLRCRSWRGRRADDPDSPGDTMCRNLALIREIQELKLDVEKRACGICPHQSTCAYLGQRKLRADLWFVAHQMIYESKPKALGELAVLIVDENPIGAALKGADHRPPVLPLDVFDRVDRIDGSGGSVATDRLMFLRRAALDVIRDHAHGQLRRVAFDDAIVTAANAREARSLEWRTRVDVELVPGMSKEERTLALEAAERNADLGRRVMFWTAIEALLNNGPEASGWAAMVGAHDAEPAARQVELKGRRDIGKAWRVPTLILDATARPEILRYLWPNLEVTADVRIAAPHQCIHQTTDAGYALSRLDVEGAHSDEERRHRTRNLRALHAIICREARRHAPGAVLVVAQQRIEKALLALGNLPLTVHMEHHNAVRGRDEYRDARALIVIGRTMPPSTTTARMLEALTGAAAPSVDYERAGAVRELPDGSMQPCEAWRYPDDTGEALRWQACEAEVVQIIGRGRAVNRTKDTPVDVLVLTDLPLPMPVQPIAAADLAPSPDDLMAAAGGIVFENSWHAADAYPEVWPSRDAAKKAVERAALGKWGTFPYKKKTLYTGMSPTSVWAQLEYQRTGRGQSPAVARFDSSLITDPAAVLTKLLGPLAWVRVPQQQPDAGATGPIAPASPVFTIPKPAEIAAMNDAEKRALRERLHAGRDDEVDGIVPEVPGCIPGVDPAALYPLAFSGGISPPAGLFIRMPGGRCLLPNPDMAPSAWRLT